MQIRNIFKFEKGSLKRKIVGLFFAMVLIIVAVVIVSKIFFPDPASDAVLVADYKLTSTVEYSKFEVDMNSASNWFKTNLSEADKKDEMGKTVGIFNDQSFLIDVLAEKAVFVQNKNGLKKLLKSLSDIKKDILKSRQEAQDYYDVQLKNYIQTGSHTSENTSLYYATFNNLFNDFILCNQKYVSVMLKISANCTLDTTTDSPLAKAYRAVASDWGDKIIANRNKSILSGEDIILNEQEKYFNFLNEKVITYTDSEFYANPNGFNNIINAVNTQNLQKLFANYETENWTEFYEEKNEDDKNAILLIVSLVEGV